MFNDYGIEYRMLLDSKPCKYEADGECLGTRYCTRTADCEVKKYLKRMPKVSKE